MTFNVFLDSRPKEVVACKAPLLAVFASFKGAMASFEHDLSRECLILFLPVLVAFGHRKKNEKKWVSISIVMDL